jgi:hypothetical protein
VRLCHQMGFFADGPVFEQETVMAMVSIFVRMVLTLSPPCLPCSSVVPAKAGTQGISQNAGLDSCFRRNDGVTFPVIG